MYFMPFNHALLFLLIKKIQNNNGNIPGTAKDRKKRRFLLTKKERAFILVKFLSKCGLFDVFIQTARAKTRENTHTQTY